MSQSSSDRIQCPNCGANNFPSSATCWQCGRPLTAEQNQGPNQNPPQDQNQNQQPEQPLPPPPAYGSPPPPQQFGGPAYGTPPPAYPPQRPQGNTKALVVLGIIFAILGLLPSCCGWIFSITAIVLGAIAATKGDKMGFYIVGGAVLALLLNFLVINPLLGKWGMNYMHTMYPNGVPQGGPNAPGGMPKMPMPTYPTK